MILNCCLQFFPPVEVYNNIEHHVVDRRNSSNSSWNRLVALLLEVNGYVPTHFPDQRRRDLEGGAAGFNSLLAFYDLEADGM